MVASAGAPSSPFCPDVSTPAIVAELGRTPRSSSCSCFSATVLAAGESASFSCPGSSTLSASAVFAEALARLPCSVSALPATSSELPGSSASEERCPVGTTARSTTPITYRQHASHCFEWGRERATNPKPPESNLQGVCCMCLLPRSPTGPSRKSKCPVYAATRSAESRRPQCRRGKQVPPARR